MRIVDKTARLGRRRFLQTSVGAAVLVGSLSGDSAFAATLTTLSPAAGTTLTKMARDIYPHDRLPDLFYQNAVETIDRDLAKAADTKTLLQQGVIALDAAANKLHGMPYAKIAGEADRVAVLKQIETSPFFAKVRGAMVTALYNQPEVWPRLGYEGSSAEHGGYLHRGFDDIDWLPA